MKGGWRVRATVGVKVQGHWCGDDSQEAGLSQSKEHMMLAGQHDSEGTFLLIQHGSEGVRPSCVPIPMCGSPAYVLNGFSQKFVPLNLLAFDGCL